MIHRGIERPADPKGDERRHGLVAWTLSSVLVTTLISLGHPFGPSDDSSLGPKLVRIGLVASQSIAFVLPGTAIASLLPLRMERLAKWFGLAWCLIVPTLVALNALTWAWIAQPLFSAGSLRVLQHANSLRGYVTWVTIGWFLVAMFLPVSLVVVSRLLGRSMTHRLRMRRTASNAIAQLGLVALAIALSVPAVFTLNETLQWAQLNPARNPMSMIRVSSLNSTRLEVESVYPSGDPAAEDHLRDADDEQSSANHMLDYQNALRRLTVTTPSSFEGESSPDILIAIVESMRPELINEQTMPSLHEYASRGIWCRQHFSSGNATTHGFFSLLNGIDASWYDSPIRFTPVLNRIFRNQGYELGFFAGDDQWSRFYMDDFIHPDHFDVFDVVARNGLDSDRHAVVQAASFLDEPSEQRAPRVAVLYLYATHATYLSYPKDQIFQPAADDRMLYPYPSDAQPEVWNRYRNSARTVDRFLSAVMQDDRIILVTGDHGEAFLEDGTIGHGTKISQVQNQTPAIAWIPGIEPQRFDTPTMHADILPTLIAALGWKWNDPQLLDGVNLLSNGGPSPSRLFVTRDYLSETLGLIGPWTSNDDEPFAFTLTLDRKQNSIGPVRAIDETGVPVSGSFTSQIDRIREWIRASR
ncbi:MAG: sulfatase-like hydrolase/transferase [Planctomycetota bacterium]